MKVFIGLVISLTVGVIGKAQDKEDSSIQKAAVSICNCLEKNHIEDSKDQGAMQAVFLQCMIDSAATVMGDLVMNSGNADLQQASEQVAQKIAMELVKMGCKPFMQMSMKVAQGNVPSPKDDKNNATGESLKTADGVVTGIEERDFLYITVKTTAGRALNFIYLDYIDNSDDWVKDPSTRLKNKQVTVQWIEKEVYQPKLKDFSNVKVLRDLKIKKS